MEKVGYVYVLTNESFHKDNWVKIGYAEDVEKRVKELSGTALPFPYKVFCTYEIPRISGEKDPDKQIHDLIQSLNPSLRIMQNREFFELDPWDAYNMLSAIAKMHNRNDKLSINESNISGQDTLSDSEYSADLLFPEGSDVRKLFEKIKQIIQSVECLQEVPLKCYVTFKKGKSKTVTLWPKRGWIEVVLGAKRGQINDPEELCYDISNRKWSSEQYAFRFYDNTDEALARNLIEQAIKCKTC